MKIQSGKKCEIRSANSEFSACPGRVMIDQRMLPAIHVSGRGYVVAMVKEVIVDPMHVREQLEKLQRSAVFADSSSAASTARFPHRGNARRPWQFT